MYNSLNITPSRNDLLHFGVSIRNGAPGRGSGRYPLGSGKEPYQNQNEGPVRTIKKGTKIYRVSDKSNGEFGEGGSTYVTYKDVDRNLYKGGYLRQLYDQRKTSPNKTSMYENSYTLEEDLKIPSRDILKEVLEKHVTKEDVNKVKFEVFKTDLLKKSSSEDSTVTSMIDTFNQAIERHNEQLKLTLSQQWDLQSEDRKFYDRSWTLKDSKIKEKVIKDLSKRGYNAMADEASIGGYDRLSRDGDDPLIIFNASKSLKFDSSSKIEKKDFKKSVKNTKQFAKESGLPLESWRKEWSKLQRLNKTRR